MPEHFENGQHAGCLKVSSKSSPASVAGAIAGMIKDGSCVEIQSVGAGAGEPGGKSHCDFSWFSVAHRHRNRLCAFVCRHRD